MIMFEFFSPDDTPELSFEGTLCIYGTNIFALPISLSLIPLSLRIMVQIYNNLTTLEMMGNKAVKYPCVGSFKTRNENGTKRDLEPNAYDMLWFNNMKQVMGSKLWMWPFPFAPELKGQGLFFPTIPDVSESDMLMRSGGRQDSQGFVESDFDIDPQSYIDKAVDKYAGNTFVLNDRDPETE